MSAMEQERPRNFQCIDAIKVSLSIEKEGLGFYEKAGQSVANKQVREVFLRLANEERDHIKTLNEKARFLQPAVQRKSETGNISNFISSYLEGRVFPTFSEEDFRCDGKEGSLKAVDLGIESEKRSIEVLNELLINEKKIDVRAIFMHLVVEEKKHLEILETLRESVSVG